MEIVVDGQNIDFTLEHEKTLFDVLQSLEQWLLSQSQVMQKVLLDENLLEDIHDNLLKQKSLHNCAKLEIVTVSKYDFGIELLVTLQEYIHNVLRNIQSSVVTFSDLETKDHLLNGIHWIYTVMGQLLRYFHIDPETLFHKDASLHDVMARFYALDNELREKKFHEKLFQAIVSEKLEELFHSFVPFLLKLSHRILLVSLKETQEEYHEVLQANIQDILESLEDFSGVLTRIGTYLQVGREVEAYLDIKNVLAVVGNIVFHLEVFQRSSAVSYSDWIIAGKSVEEENRELKLLVEKLEQAFAHKDNVLLGDLLEYELIEQFERYKRIFRECVAMIAANTYT